jgi:hypothetical protein
MMWGTAYQGQAMFNTAGTALASAMAAQFNLQAMQTAMLDQQLRMVIQETQRLLTEMMGGQPPMPPIPAPAPQGGGGG